MNEEQIINWLKAGDVSLLYQVHRDLLRTERIDLQKRIGSEGWGKQFLSKQRTDGHWGRKFYQPKWISTHYTLLDLRNLCLHPENQIVQKKIHSILATAQAKDGGIQLGPSTAEISDTCVNGMFLNYASYFQIAEDFLIPLIDCLIDEWMPDGGFNCRKNRGGARHSSMHTTLSVLEGLFEFQKAGNQYRKVEVQKAIESAQEFLLLHQLFLSDRTGKIIHKDFLKLTYPSRWKFDILRALDHFQYAKVKWDERLMPSIHVLLQKQKKDGTWHLQAKHPGQEHFEMEKAGKPSRWNTLRALRVLRYYGIPYKNNA